MLAISSCPNQKTVTPNILPCKITHSGPIPISKTHWNPSTSQPPTAHFRGRKLQGHKVALPEGYQGVVLQKTDKALPQSRDKKVDVDVEMDGEEEEEVEVKIMEKKGKFDEVIVWGHEVVPDEEDVYRKGIEEWIGFAEAMHSYDTPSTTT